MGKITLVFFALFSFFLCQSQAVVFPDQYLKSALLDYSPAIDVNGNNEIEVSEALLVTELILPRYQQPDVIENLTGLQAFTNLLHLDISQTNAYGTFDVSPFTHLQYLNCSEQPYATITGIVPLSNSLVVLDCSRTNVPELSNISAMVNLEFLDCSHINNLGSLNVSNLTHLEYLNCADSDINSLNISGSALHSMNCSANALTSLNLTSLPTLSDLDCSYNLGLITTPAFGNITSLARLNCTYTGLTTLNLTALTNLIFLDCSQNSLTSLNFSNLENLTELYCSYNNLGSIDVTALSNLRKLYCVDTHLTSLNVNSLTNLKELSCRLNQLQTLDINQLVNLEVLDFGYNQISTMDLSPFTQLKDLRCLYNSLTSLNVTNAPLLVTLDCAYNQIANLDLSNNIRLQNTDCSGNLFTSLDFSSYSGTGIGGFAQYSFSNNPLLEFVNVKCGHSVHVSVPSNLGCPNLEYICADEQSVNSIRGYLYMWGQNQDVQVNPYCTFYPGGPYNTISGTVNTDVNGNGCDGVDPHFANVRVNISNGTSTSSTFTDAQGNYTFYLPAGNYTLSPQPEAAFSTITPASAAITFATDNSPAQNQDFCLSANGVHNDVQITLIPNENARPGFDVSYTLTYKNKGNQTLSGSIGLAFNDAVLDFVSATPSLESQSLNNLTWNYSNLMPFESRSISFTLNLNGPMETPPVNIDDILNFTATISPIMGDETPDDNTFSFAHTVRGSYDPNDKICLEGNFIRPENVGDYLHYVIHFQNSGTAPAESIVVKDVLDAAKFDISTLQLTSSSHPQVTRINGNKVEFVFEGINLPAEIDNEPASHGYVAFKIKTKSNLVLGNNIENTADIHFDYNFPIVTNTTSTTVSTLGIHHYEDATVNFYPNPVKNILSITAKSNITSIQLFDVQGRLIATKLNSSMEAKIDLSTQSAGVYFVKAITDSGIKTEKIIKQ